MSVYISHAGEILSIPAEDDLAPHLLCDDDCRTCLTRGTNGCPVRMRQFEQIADWWMLETSTYIRLDKKRRAA